METRVFTNGGPSVAMRSPAWPQGVYAMEGFLDEMAHALGMDPLEFRKKNTTDEVYLAQWEMGAKMIGWDRRNKVPGSGKGPIKRGLGMASSMWRNMGGRDGIVDVVIHRDGTVEVQERRPGHRHRHPHPAGRHHRRGDGHPPAAGEGLAGPDQVAQGSLLGRLEDGGRPWRPVIRRSAFQAKEKLLALASAKLGVPAAELRIEDGLVAGRRARA